MLLSKHVVGPKCNEYDLIDSLRLETLTKFVFRARDCSLTIKAHTDSIRKYQDSRHNHRLSNGCSYETGMWRTRDKGGAPLPSMQTPNRPENIKSVCFITERS